MNQFLEVVCNVIGIGLLIVAVLLAILVCLVIIPLLLIVAIPAIAGIIALLYGAGYALCDPLEGM